MHLIKMPKKICSTYDGYSNLINNFNKYTQDEFKNSTICIDFSDNNWFDSNLLPIIYGYVEYGVKFLNISSQYKRSASNKLHELMIRNGFASQCFNMTNEPHKKETVIPFKIFNATETRNFAVYIEQEIVKYFPKMDDDVQKDLSNYIQELFGNAQIHTDCTRVYTCGQYYPKKQKMDFTIVNLGRTIRDNVKKYFNNNKNKIPMSTVQWAVEPGNTTKLASSGGLGLTLMRDFIHFNCGKYQIISGYEFWELNAQRVITKEFIKPFPGTIVNIEISQNDKKFYHYEQVDNIF